MDQSDEGNDAKRRALPQQPEQPGQQRPQPQGSQQQWRQQGAPTGFGLDPSSSQQPLFGAGGPQQQVPFPSQQQPQLAASIPGSGIAAAAASYPPAAAAQPQPAAYAQQPPHSRQQQPPQQQPPVYVIQQQHRRHSGPYATTAPSQQQQPYGAPMYATSYEQQQQQLQQQQQAAAAAAGIYPHHPSAAAAAMPQAPAAVAGIPPHPSFIQPKVGRLPADRPLIKLSVSLIDTYKQINTVYYEEREARRAARAKEKKGQGSAGWDDENYDYIVTSGEIFYGRYRIKERIGKGSFGQVVRAEDIQSNREVAIKIIKSKKPFLLQAKTEIELLTHLWEKDPKDENNIVRLLTHFMYRNHQCLVFEMLSLNLYELLKNTQFGGVSLNLIRKFAKQVLKALAFLARSDVDVIHCDLKPENILLRHPKKSGVKVIDFGSSCRSNRRMYSYIQSRFYRSPEVMLGLPYSVAIDMWSLGCILVEMHTGEPLFSGSDQFDQMQKIVKLLGMVPDQMLSKATDQIRTQFFEPKTSTTGSEEWTIRQTKAIASGSKSEASSTSSSPTESKQKVVPSADPVASLTEVITTGTRQKKKFPPSEAYNSQRNYTMFVDLVYKMLAYDPSERIKPTDALAHPFIISGEPPSLQPAAATTTSPRAAGV